RQQQIEAISLLQQSIYNKMFMEKQNDQSEVLLKDVCSINPRKSEIEEELHDLEISFIPMVSVSEDGDIDLNESRILKEVYRNYTYFAENDILFAKITPCMENGKGAIARGLQNKIGFGSSEFHVLRPKKGTTPEWVYFLTKSKKFRKTAEENMTGSAGQKRVPRKFLENYPVMLPSKSKQEEFKNIYYKTEKNKQVLNESLRELEKLNASLLQKAFNGELFNNKVNI
ncbi:MAG TPA: restriction endonuclease subunit S, partial [Pseudogracilibacillus sp.]|nr:restriction endonuclease subunit S [Pseudogracilibacillus sp.]